MLTTSITDSKDPILFNWIALPHRNPDAWYAGAVPPYADAGRQEAGTVWDSTSSTEGGEAWLNCKKVAFAQPFGKTPTVLVTATHREAGDLDWGAVSSPSFTYVGEVNGNYFRVCSTERGRVHDATLSWDWVAFGEVWGEAAGLGLKTAL
jgi:hypothetical protein